MVSRTKLALLVVVLAVVAVSDAAAAVYVNRDYYWDESTKQWRYNLVDRYYTGDEPTVWNANSDFGHQGQGPDYVLERDVYVQPGATLRIGQGVTVKISGGRGFYVSGTLSAQGSQAERIVFTSTSGSPGPGSWREIAFLGSGANASEMRYCDISYGGDGGYVSTGGFWHYARGLVLVSDCSPSFEHCTFSHSANYAFYGYDACQADISHCSFTNSVYGMVLQTSSYHEPFGVQLPIRSCSFTSNSVGTHCSAQAAGAFDANNTVTGNTRNVCEVYGSTVQNAPVWHTMLGNPVWYVLGDVHCGAASSISIEPGSVVKLANKASIYSWGTFTASGTPANRIYFTSALDDTVGGDSNGDGAATSPAPGDWSQILLIDEGSDGSHVTQCEFRFGGSGRYTSAPGFWLYEWGMLSLWNADASVAGSTFSMSGYDGIHLWAGSRPTVSSCSFTQCGRYAIRCDDIDSNPVVSASNASGCGCNGIRIPGGVLTGARTWYKSIPYVVEPEVFLRHDAALAIQPGAAVKFTSNSGLFVAGNLQAVGTAAEPIYFTSLTDDIYGDTNNNGAATAPAPGSWRDVALYGETASPSRLEWCVFRYGGNGAYDSSIGIWYYHYGNLFTGECSPVIKSCISEYSGHYGIHSRWASNPVIENSTVRHNTWGIVIEDDAFHSTTGTPRVRNTTFTENTWGASLSAEALSQFDSNNIFSGNTSNGLQVYASSIANESATWRRMMGSPTIVIAGLVQVPAGKALTITQNNVVKFKTAMSLYSFGNLQVAGSDGNRVVFTSYADDSVDGDTNADGADTAPAPGDWNSILFSGGDSSSSAMRYCKVRFGARGSYDSNPGYYLTHNGNVMFYHSDAGLYQVDVEKAASYGIVVLSGCHPTLSSTRITGSGSYAMWQGITSNSMLSGCSATGNAWNGILLEGGSVGDARTWCKSIPYVMAAHIDVAGTAQLTLQPGTVVKLHPGVSLVCYGNLQSVAEDLEPKVVFTSVKDDAAGGDTNGDGNATQPAPGDWAELLLRDASTDNSHLKNSIVRYGGNNQFTSDGGFWHYAYAPLHLSMTQAVVEGCEISHSGNVGIYCSAGCQADITGSSIHSNTSHGLYIENSYNTVESPVSIRGNDIYGNVANAAVSVNANASLSIAGDNSVHDNAQNCVEIRDGDLTASGTWHKISAGACPFLIRSHVHCSAPPLRIEPGVTVKFRDGAWLGVATQVLAQGTDEERIAFTSFKDDTLAGDTNGDGGTTSPAGGDYTEVFIYGDGGSSVFENCIFRYGGDLSYESWGGIWHSAEGNVFIHGVAPVFDHCEFSFSGRDGVANGGADVTYQNCTFTNNTRMGLYTWGDSDVALNSCISANNPYAATQINGEEGGSLAATYCDLIGPNYLRKLVLNPQSQWVWQWTNTFPAGDGNFSADPLFVNAAQGDFTLRPVSPCINTGDINLTDADGSRRDVGAYPFLGIWNPMSCGAIKQSTDGTEVLLIGKVVTAGTNLLGTELYVEEEDRSSGVKVLTGVEAPVGSVVNVYGRLAVDDGERALVETDVAVVSATGTVPDPVHVVGKAIGGPDFNQFTPGIPGSDGTYNLGLLINASGQVTAVEAGAFWINDGSGRVGEGGKLGIKVISDARVSIGAMVRVTGISAAYVDDGVARSVVLTRSASDIEAL